jgi:hypothetical protein
LRLQRRQRAHLEQADGMASARQPAACGLSCVRPTSACLIIVALFGRPPSKATASPWIENQCRVATAVIRLRRSQIGGKPSTIPVSSRRTKPHSASAAPWRNGL